jgi:ABC-2 type transport system permease protein
MRVPIEWSSLASNAVLQLAWIAVFGALAYGRFTTKDILS